jgi:rhodanese-related sulfurtransferase
LQKKRWIFAKWRQDDHFDKSNLSHSLPAESTLLSGCGDFSNGLKLNYLEVVMKKIMLIITMLLFSNRVWSLDEGLARGYSQYFQPFDGKATSKALHFVKVTDFVEAIKSGEKLFVPDIRTPAETGMIAMGVSDKLLVPMNHVFIPAVLSKIPTDRKVVVVCKAGVRAMAIATALRHTCFKNLYVLKGGIAGLAQYVVPKTVY